jgi:hypothetical protein
MSAPSPDGRGMPSKSNGGAKEALPLSISVLVDCSR